MSQALLTRPVSPPCEARCGHQSERGGHASQPRLNRFPSIHGEFCRRPCRPQEYRQHRDDHQTNAALRRWPGPSCIVREKRPSAVAYSSRRGLTNSSRWLLRGQPETTATGKSNRTAANIPVPSSLAARHRCGLKCVGGAQVKVPRNRLRSAKGPSLHRRTGPQPKQHAPIRFRTTRPARKPHIRGEVVPQETAFPRPVRLARAKQDNAGPVETGCGLRPSTQAPVRTSERMIHRQRTIRERQHRG